MLHDCNSTFISLNSSSDRHLKLQKIWYDHDMYSKVTKTIELYKTAAYRFWQGYFQRFVDLRVYSYIFSYIQSSLIEKLRKLATTKR